MSTRLTSTFSFAAAIFVGLAIFLSNPPQATASLGTRINRVASYFSPINLGAEKYFTINLQPTASAHDAALVANYFRAFGLSVSISPDNHILFAHGTYGEAAAAARTSFGRYSIGSQRYTSLTRPETYPPMIASRIVATTINDGISMHPFNELQPAGFFDPTGGFTPSQYETFYDISSLRTASINGTGQAVAIFACATVSLSDISTFESDFGLNANTPNIVMVDGGTTSTDFEPTGDIERVLSTAPKVTIYLYVVPTTCTSGEMADALAKMAVDSATKKFKSVNISYGTSEDDIKSSGGTSGETAIDTDLSTLINTKGVTPFAASGDSGSFESTSSPFWFTPGEITANFPASDPNVMAVGGTSAFTTSSSSSTRLIENAWSGSGGGVSSTWKIPGRQVGVPGIASTTMRNVPDVALNADLNTGYVLNFSGAGGLVLGGGTSFASPGWAGFLALVNQKRAALGKAALTLVPKNIYAQRGTTGFLDIVNGSNGFYSAKAGYDNVTGLGVFDAAKLYAALIALP